MKKYKKIVIISYCARKLFMVKFAVSCAIGRSV